MTHSATHFVALTPPGRGAVAVILVFGPQAIEVCSQEFVAANGKALNLQPLNRIVFGNWGRQAVEELVVCRTADETLEIHCHGGHAAVMRIRTALREHGCSQVSKESYYELQSGNRFNQLAGQQLQHACTERTALILLDQFNGAMAYALQNIRTMIAAGLHAKAIEEIDRVLQWTALGSHLTRPWQVALAGPPNVGKSSLINALVGYQRSLVFDEPGTTRDVVSAVTAFRGWPIELSDTAGLRRDADPIERAGIERARQQMTSADLVVLTFDCSRPWTVENQTLCEAWPEALVVLNKIDLQTTLATQPSEQACATAANDIRVSALHGEGLSTLIDEITLRLMPTEPERGAAVPFDQSVVQMLQSLRQSLT